MVTVQALNVVLEPNRLRQALVINGRATPVTLFAAHIMPSARPFLRTNHWSRYKEDGLKSKPLPMAHITPWVAMRCHTVFEKDDRSEPMTVTTKPVGAQYACRRGYRVNIVKVTGERR